MKLAQALFFAAAALILPSQVLGDQSSATSDLDGVTLQVEVGTHSGPIRRIASSSAQDIVVTVSDDKTARVWRLGSHDLLRTLRVPAGQADQGRLYGVALHPSNGLVAIGGTAVEREKGRTRAEIFLFEIGTGLLRQRVDAGEAEIKRLAWSADGALLIAGTAGRSPSVLFYDSSWRPVLRHPMAGAVYGLSTGRDGTVIATDFSGALQMFAVAGSSARPMNRIALPSAGPVSVALVSNSKRAVVGYFASQHPTIVDLASGRVERQLEPRERDIDSGYLMTVAWSADGRSVYAAGATRRPGNRVGLWRFDAATGEQQSLVDVASDTVLDLVGVDESGVLFASFDASWGRVDGDRVSARVMPAVGDLQGVDGLQSDADGFVVSWSRLGSGGTRKFDMMRRLVDRGPGVGLHGPITRNGLTGGSVQVGDAKGRLPYVVFNGQRLALGEGELAISATYLSDSNDVVIGTSKSLMRTDAAGRAIWRIVPGAEVNAVVAARSSKLLVTAMSDGTIRWWNAKDGALLMTLLSTRAGAWIVWTPYGYYDSGPGADGLVGWLISHPADGTAELHSLSRFRDRYQRPDVVDRVLQTLDLVEAVTHSAPSDRDMQRPVLALVPAAVPVARPDLAPTPTPAQPSRVEPAANTTTPAPSSGPADALPTAPLSPKEPSPPVNDGRLAEAPIVEASASAASRTDDARAIAVPAKAPQASVASGSASAQVTASSIDATLLKSIPVEAPPALSAIDLASVHSTTQLVTLRFAVRTSQQSSVVIVARLNGRPVDAEVVLPSAYDGRSPGNLTLRLPAGDTTVYVLAIGKSGVSDPLVFAVTVALPQSAITIVTPAVPPASQSTAGDRRPRLFALSIGVSQYQRADYRLGWAAKDARDFAEALEHQRNKEYRSVEVRPLVDGQATQVEVIVQ